MPNFFDSLSTHAHFQFPITFLPLRYFFPTASHSSQVKLVDGGSYTICASFVSSSPPTAIHQTDLSSLGSEASGNVFPGVTRPYGMVKLGPDLTSGQANAYSGYLPDGNFSGFSMMHLSGTGGVPMYGVVSQLPVVGEIANPLGDLGIGRMSPDEAEVGCYRAYTSQGVEVELAATEHAAMYQYTFPEPDGNIVVDLSHRLPSFRGYGLEQRFDGGNIDVDADGRYQGSAIYSNGYNMAPPWTIYFCTLFVLDLSSQNSAYLLLRWYL